MSNFKSSLVCLAFIFLIGCSSRSSLEKGELKISINYSDGLSSQSTFNDPPKILVGNFRENLSLLITNKTKKDVYLWQPNYSGGDLFSFEFKLSKESENIKKAFVLQLYFGSQSIPKIMRISSGSVFVYKVDFNDSWRFPYEIRKGESKKLFIRAIYNSERLNPFTSSSLDKEDIDLIWTGKVSTEWQEVVICNQTGKDL